MADDKETGRMESVTVKLSKPIVVEGEAVNTIVLQEPTLGCIDGLNLDVEICGEGDDLSRRFRLKPGELIGVVAGMAQIPPSAAKQIRIRDLIKCRGALQDFFGDFLEITG